VIQAAKVIQYYQFRKKIAHKVVFLPDDVHKKTPVLGRFFI